MDMTDYLRAVAGLGSIVILTCTYGFHSEVTSSTCDHQNPSKIMGFTAAGGGRYCFACNVVEVLGACGSYSLAAYAGDWFSDSQIQVSDSQFAFKDRKLALTKGLTKALEEIMKVKEDNHKVKEDNKVLLERISLLERNQLKLYIECVSEKQLRSELDKASQNSLLELEKIVENNKLVSISENNQLVCAVPKEIPLCDKHLNAVVPRRKS